MKMENISILYFLQTHVYITVKEVLTQRYHLREDLTLKK